MRKRNFPALMLAAAVLLALPACQASWQPDTPPEDTPEPPARFEDAVEQFSITSAAELLSGTENSCYSPVSAYFALAMAAAGASEETQAQLLALLGAEDTDTLAENCTALYGQLYCDEEQSKLYLANSIWTREDVVPREAYLTRLGDAFYAEQFSVPFGETQVNQQITDWVSERTQGLLEPEFSYEADTVAVLLNTIYFKDAWAEPFSEARTERGFFTNASGTAVEADFMHTGTVGAAYDGETWKGASLPLADGAEMFFLLPKEGQRLEALLQEEGLQKLLAADSTGTYAIEWAVPKFSQSAERNLIPMLQTLGVTDAFDPGLADFSQAFDAETPAYISAVRQGTSFTVDEAGVEAAAFTEVAMNESAAMPPEETLQMQLDRPFLYGVRSSSGTLLFIGVCADPAV